MKFTADTSAIIQIYTHGREIDAIERFVSSKAKVLLLSELARIEVLNVLLSIGSEKAETFVNDLDEGKKLRLESVNRDHVWVQAESLARRFAPRLKPGGHDLVLVAAAVTMGANWFLSFDHNSRQRPLAAAAGLKVWPPLTKDEKGLARHR